MPYRVGNISSTWQMRWWDKIALGFTLTIIGSMVIVIVITVLKTIWRMF